MKKLLLLTFSLLVLISCKSDDEEFAPNLSFSIQNGSRVASSTINVTNTTTNENGGYTWEVTSNGGTETFGTQNLSFEANRVADYTIKLKSNQFDLQTEETITTTRPSRLLFNKITLEDIPQDYSSLYFKINKITINGSSYTYTSPPRQNISSIFPGGTDWNVDVPGNLILLDNGDDVDNLAVYQIEFYDGNDNLVTKINSFSNTYIEGAEFIAGEETLTTTSIGCSECDYFEVIADFSFM